MKNYIKFISTACLIIAAMLNTSATKAQNPSIAPSSYSTTMSPGQVQSARFHANNAIVQQVLLINEMDPEVPIEINNQNTFFDITIRAIGAVIASRIVTYILKAVLMGNPYTGLIIFTCDVLISIVAAYVIISAPILRLPMLALLTERLTIKQGIQSNSSISKRKTTNPLINLAIA